VQLHGLALRGQQVVVARKRVLGTGPVAQLSLLCGCVAGVETAFQRRQRGHATRGDALEQIRAQRLLTVGARGQGEDADDAFACRACF
jgi:hypothetical protein